MGLVTLPGVGNWLTSFPGSALGSNVSVNAAGESSGAVGYIHVPAGSTGVISAAGGGRILWGLNTGTWASGSSNFRVGIQDVNLTTGLEDGTFDTYADITGGAGVTTSSWNSTALTSGTKTLVDLDLIAIVGELTARGGTDTLSLRQFSSVNPPESAGPSFPYGTQDTGTLAKTATPFMAAILFDDGFLGWIEGLAPFGSVNLAATGVSIDTGTTPDEYAATFQIPFQCRLRAVKVDVFDLAEAGSDFEVILYTDPFGSPSAAVTVPVTRVVTAASTSAGTLTVPLAATLAANTDYGVAVRPTTTANISYRYYDLGSGFNILKSALPFLVPKVCGRSDQTGAFSEVQTYYSPIFGLQIDQLHDGSGGGGSSFNVSAVFGG